MTTPDRNAVRTAMRFRSSPPPPKDDPVATLAWLRDREVIKDLYDRYAYGVDSMDLDLVRSVFHPDCVVVGTMEQGTIDDYLEGLADGLGPYEATMHGKSNQYVELDGDEAFVETYVVAHHVEAPGSPIADQVLGVRYLDDLVRDGDDWKIIRRQAAKQWHTGPLPRPFIGEPPYPRSTHQSRARTAPVDHEPGMT
jgi:ketosteroid isomerase-like protein